MADHAGELRDLLVEFPAVLSARFGRVDEDMVQDGREAMLRAAARYDADSAASFKTWVVQRGVWEAVDKWRRRHHSRSGRGLTFRTLTVRDQAVATGEPDVFAAVDARLDAEHECARVVALIDRLSERDRVVLQRVAAGEPQQSISVALGIDPSRVSQIVGKFRRDATPLIGA